MNIEGLYIKNNRGDLINIENLDKSKYETIYNFIKEAEELTNRIDKELSELPRCINTGCCDNHNGMNCKGNSTSCHNRKLLECTNCECSDNLKGKYCKTSQFTCTDRKPY